MRVFQQFVTFKLNPIMQETTTIILIEVSNFKIAGVDFVLFGCDNISNPMPEIPCCFSFKTIREQVCMLQVFEKLEGSQGILACMRECRQGDAVL